MTIEKQIVTRLDCVFFSVLFVFVVTSCQSDYNETKSTGQPTPQSPPQKKVEGSNEHFKTKDTSPEKEKPSKQLSRFDADQSSATDFIPIGRKQRFHKIKNKLAAQAKAAAMSPEVVLPRDRDAVNVVLITIDTQRADFTGPYGEKHATTPFLSKLASQGITFSNVFSAAPWTVPSMYSIITSLYSKEHGIVGGIVGGRKKKGGGQQVLPDEANTLPELMRSAGYTTFGVCTNHHMNSKFGFAQGFDYFSGGDFLFLPFPNLVVNAYARKIKESPKYFFWLHYFDPHFPYIAQSPWFGKWNDSKYRTQYDLTQEIVLQYYRSITGLELSDPIAPNHAKLLTQTIRRVSINQSLFEPAIYYAKPSPDDDYMKCLRAAYKSNLRQTDEAMKEALETIGVDDNTLLIITADHGEEFFDHGKFGHRTNNSVFQELIKVPLVIRLPGKKHAGKIINTPVSTLDILPTIMELTDQKVPSDISGVSLVPLIEGKTIAPRPLFSEYSGAQKELRTIIEYPWKYIYDFKDDKAMLFNLQKDPKEKNDLREKEKKRADEMHKRLLNWVNRTKVRWQLGPPVKLSDQEFNRLKQMGYMDN